MAGVLQTLNGVNYSKEKLESGKLKVSIEITNDRFVTAKDRVYERLAPTINIPGFRPGQAPKNLITAQLGPTLFEETLGELIPQVTLEIIRKEDLIPLDQIEYKVEKVAEGTGVTYSATFSTFPEFELPDLKGIKVEKKQADVTDQEIDKVVQQMFEDSKKAGTEETQASPADKPDDTWASTLSLGVKTLEELRTSIKDELKRQKELIEQNRYIDEIIKQIIAKTSFVLPANMVDSEVGRRKKMYVERIERLGMKVEDFLKSQNTTFAELEKGWRKEAEESIRAEIILMRLVKKYDIKVADKEVDDQIAAVQDENLRKQYESLSGRQQIQTILVRQKVIKRLLEEIEAK